MPSAAEPVIPGPPPLFTERLCVKVRPDQLAAVQRIAKTFGCTVSDAVRLLLDMSTTVTESAITEVMESNHADHT